MTETLKSCWNILARSSSNLWGDSRSLPDEEIGQSPCWLFPGSLDHVTGPGACFNNEAMLTDCLRIPRERCVAARSARVRSSLFSSGKNENPGTYLLFNRECARGTHTLQLCGCLWSNPPPCGISTITFYTLSFFPYRFYRWEVDMQVPVWFIYQLPCPLRTHTHTHTYLPWKEIMSGELGLLCFLGKAFR